MNITRLCANCARSSNCQHKYIEEGACNYRAPILEVKKDAQKKKVELHEAIRQSYGNNRRGRELFGVGGFQG